MRSMQQQDETFHPSAPLTAQNSPPAFRLEAVRSVRMHMKLACMVAACVFVLIVLFALTRRPVYEAESLTYVEPLATKVMSDGSPGFYDPSRYDSYLDQQIQTAQRPDILAAAAAKLPEGVWRHHGESIPAAAARLGSVIVVKRVGTSYQLSISATGPDPVGTAAAVNAVTDAYLEQGSKDEHAMSDGRIQLLTEERQRIQNELQQAHAEQNSLSSSLGVANPVGESGNPYDAQLAELRTELAGAREAHDVAAALLQSMSMHGDLHSAGLVAAANETIAGDSGLSTMKSSINQRRATLQSQMALLTPANPVYKQDQQEIAAMDRNLDTMTVQLRGKAEQNLQDKLRQELERTGEVEARLNAQLAQDTARATGAAPKLQRATELAADILRLQGAFAGVDDSLRALQLETQGPGMAHLSVAATPPTAPAASRRNQMLLLAIPLAFLAGIAAAVIARKRDPRAYTGLDLQHMLGFPPMAVMPTGNEVSEAVMEEYLLRLAAGVERAYRAQGARTFLFTAVSPSTEITELIEDLAAKLSELGFAVRTIDVNTVMGPVEDQSTDSRRGAGAASLRLQQLQQEHDLLLIEARPLLFSAEAEYAACASDVTVLVAESGMTLCKELKDAASLLERLHVKGVAVVLQELRLAVADPRFVAAVEELERRAYRQRRRKSKARKEVAATRDETRLSEPTAFTQEPHVAAPHDGHEELLTVPIGVAAEQEVVADEQHAEHVPQAMDTEEVPRSSAAVFGNEVATAEDVEIPEASVFGVEPATHEPIEEPRTVVSQTVQELTEQKIKEIVAAPDLFRPSAPRQSAMWSADDYQQPKPSFFDRIFKRFHEPVVSIVPQRDEEPSDDAYVETSHATQTETAVAESPLPKAIDESRASEDLHKAGHYETPAVMEEPALETASLAAVDQQQLRESIQLNSEAMPTISAVNDEPQPVIEAVEIAEQAAPEPAYYATAEVELPELTSVTTMREEAAPQKFSTEIQEVEAVPQAIEPVAAAVVQPEAATQNPPEPPAFPPRQIITESAVTEVAQATPPTMRQWEFRQARSMRENAAHAAMLAEEAVAFRRTSRPGVLSATGRRTLVDDTVAPRSVRSRQPSSWLEEPTRNEPQIELAMPVRKWGMLSRFDRRFGETESSASHELDDEKEVAVYETSGHGARRD